MKLRGISLVLSFEKGEIRESTPKGVQLTELMLKVY